MRVTQSCTYHALVALHAGDARPAQTLPGADVARAVEAADRVTVTALAACIDNSQQQTVVKLCARRVVSCMITVLLLVTTCGRDMHEYTLFISILF